MLPSQHIVYASSYAPAGKPGIYKFIFDDQTGALEPLGSVSGIENPSFIAPHPKLDYIYSVGETGGSKPGTVWAVRLSDKPLFKLMGSQRSEGDAPCHLEIDRTGRWIVVSNYGSGSAAVFPIRDDGKLGKQVSVVQNTGSGPVKDRQASCHAHSSAFTPDGKYVIVADLGSDDLRVYNFDSSSGRLTLRANVKSRPGSGPRHMVFHPNGHILYVVHELDNTVSVYDYEQGNLHERQVITSLPPDAGTSSIADVHIDAEANRLYVSNRGYDSIAVYDIAADGALSLVAIRPCGGAQPRNFAIAPRERFLLVANQKSGEISVLPILPGREALGAPVTKVSVPGVSCVRFK